LRLTGALTLDWSNTPYRKQHCQQAKFLAGQKQIGLPRGKKLAELLDEWRKQFTQTFSVETLNAPNLPNTWFYNIKVPADILPAFNKQSSKRVDSRAADNIKLGKSKKGK
jgi:hypothetical protein